MFASSNRVCDGNKERQYCMCFFSLSIWWNTFVRMRTKGPRQARSQMVLADMFQSGLHGKLSNLNLDSLVQCGRINRESLTHTHTRAYTHTHAHRSRLCVYFAYRMDEMMHRHRGTHWRWLKRLTANAKYMHAVWRSRSNRNGNSNDSNTKFTHTHTLWWPF